MKSRRLQFNFLKEKIEKRAGGWKNKLISMGGKEVLIKAVLQSIPTYTMSCFKVPISICQDIERLCARFWWGEDEQVRKMHWTTWRELCKPKSKGGMGFRDLIAFNQALLAKQVWRLILNPESLVASIFRAKYYYEKDIMDVPKIGNASFVWKSLLWGRDLLQNGLRWKVENGQKVRIFRDAWIPGFASGKTITNGAAGDETKVSYLLTDNLQWDMVKLNAMLLPVDVEEVQKVELIDRSWVDKRYWKYDQKGMYNVKSGYLVATKYFEPAEFSTSSAFSQWWKFLWSFDLPPKVRIFVWRVFKNYIPTELNLANHHVPVKSNCSSCKGEWSSTVHALIHCQKIRARWESFDFWKDLKKCRGLNIGEVGLKMRQVLSRERFRCWLMGLWLVWKDICQEKHEEIPIRLDNFEASCVDFLTQYDDARLKIACRNMLLPKIGDLQWKNPRRGRYRLDVDYGEDEATGKGGVGAIVRDCDSKIVVALAKPVQRKFTILAGELVAILFGLCLCIEHNIAPVEVYTDSILAIHVLQEQDKSKSVLWDDLFEAISEAKELCVLSVNHMRREANKAAHELACFGKSLDEAICWLENWPSWLLSVVMSDSN